MQSTLTRSRLPIYGMLCLIGIGTALSVVWLIKPQPGNLSLAAASFEESEKKPARIYEVGALIGHPGEETATEDSPPPLAKTLTQEFSEVEAATRLFPETNCVGRNGSNVYVESNAYRADGCFFEVFDFSLLVGNPEHVLADPFSVVLTQSAANRYFGKEEALYRPLILNNQSYTVTGIVADPTSCGPLQFDLLLSMATHAGMQENDNWSWNVVQTYLRLNDQASARELEDRLSVVVDKYARPFLGKSFDSWVCRGGKLKYFLQAV